MALVEIEDTVLNRLKSFEEIFDKVGKSPDRLKLLHLVKTHFPEIPIPEVDAAKPVYDRVDALERRIAEREAEWEKKEKEREEEETKRTANRSISDNRRALRDGSLDGFGWDDEGIEKVETYMRETGNPDYKSAAAYVRAQMPVPPDHMPTSVSGQQWNWFRPPENDVDHKLLLKNPRAYQDSVVSAWLKDMRQQRGRAA